MSGINIKIGTISTKFHYPYEGIFGKATPPEYIIKEVTGNGYINLTNAVANHLMELKAYGGTEQRNLLPSGYTELDGIIGDGKAYIDLNCILDQDDEVELYFTNPQTLQSKSVFGARETVSSKNISILCASTGNIVLDINDSDYTDYRLNQAISTNTMYKAVINKNGRYVYNGDTLVGSNTTPCLDVFETGGCYLFNMFGGGYANKYNGIINKCVIKGKRELIPCKNSDNEVGMYDVLNGVFYRNADTTGSFTAGTAITPTPDKPMDIVSNNGALKYGAIGKNILDMADRNIVLGKYINDSGQILDSSLNFYNEKYTEVKPNTTYTWSVSKIARYISIMEYDENRTFIQRTLFDNGSSVLSNQVTTTANTKYILLGSNIESKIVTLAKIRGIDRQIEEGDTATTYEAYVGGIYTEGTTETILLHKKNLFNKATVSKYTLLDTSTGKAIPQQQEWSWCSDFIAVNPNTAYYFKAGANYNVRIFEYTVDKSYTSTNYTVLNNSFTVGATCKLIRFHVGRNTGGQDMYEGETMLSLGSTETEYEPYFNGDTATAEMLLKIGDVIDEQEILSGAITRKIGIKVLDGTETWSKTAARPNTYVSSQVITDRDISNRTTFCSHFISTDVNDNLENPGYFVVGASTQTISFSLPTSITSGTAFSEWLEEQYKKGIPVIILYVLSTPTTETATGQTINIPKGDSTIEVTQASIGNLGLYAKYKATE